MSRAQGGATGPGSVKVRLLGEPSACSALAALLGSSATVDVLSADGPFVNRREPGGRLYLTLRARQAEAARPEVRFDLGDGGDTYFVLTEALLDFAARERAAADPHRQQLARVADEVLAQIDAALSLSQWAADHGGRDYGDACPECGAGSVFNGMSGGTPCWLCPACGHQRAGFPEAAAPASETSEAPAGRIRQGLGAPISSRSPLDA